MRFASLNIECTFLKKLADLLTQSLIEATNMSEEVHPNVEQRIIIKFLTKDGVKYFLGNCTRMEKAQYGKKTSSDISIYKWSKALKKGDNTSRMNRIPDAEEYR